MWKDFYKLPKAAIQITHTDSAQTHWNVSEMCRKGHGQQGINKEATAI